MKTVYALGYFECVHPGHRAVLRETVALAQIMGTAPGCFSYIIEPGETVRPDRLSSSFTPKKRTELIKECGIEVIHMPLFSSLKNLSPEEFLGLLIGDYAAVGFVCGEDYRFGKGAAGSADTLKNYCAKNNIAYKIIKTVCDGNTKISSKNVKNKA